VNPFFERYVRLLADEAAAAGHPLGEGGAVVLDSQLSRALLELTRVVAHSQERRFGPLVAYLTGAALAGSGLDDAAAAQVVERVASRLEQESTAPD
jgi:hypothetical protein